jgi:hypothetical protein
VVLDKNMTIKLAGVHNALPEHINRIQSTLLHSALTVHQEDLQVLLNPPNVLFTPNAQTHILPLQTMMTVHLKATEVVNVEQDTIDRLIFLAVDLLLDWDKDAMDLRMAIMCHIPLSQDKPLATPDHFPTEISKGCKCHLGLLLHAQYCWMGHYGAWEQTTMVK